MRKPFGGIAALMREYRIPMTRENYIALNYLGSEIPRSCPRKRKRN